MVQEHAETVEIYRPNFEQVAQAAVISVKKPSSGRLGNLIRTVVKLALTGALGTVAVTGYRQGWGPLLQPLRQLSSHALTIISNRSNSNGQFWSGFGMASIGQLSLTVGLAMWITTKLDVQQEFTHYSPRRTTRTDQIFLRKRPLSSIKSKSFPKPQRSTPLEPRTWKNFPLVRKDNVSPNVYRFVFGLPHEDDILGLPTGQHIALRAKINGESVSRSYTPVSNNTDLGRIELLVKVYPQGKMTKHLESMQIGDMIEIRGPKGAMQYTTSYAKHIGMVAGGTGISPMYQLIRAICDDETDSTQISLLYANNTEEDILLRHEMDTFAKKYPKKFQVQYVLSQAAEGWKGHRGFVSQDLIQKYLAPADQSNRMLLCGPPPMINAMKKVLVGLGWKEPGALSKATDQVFLF